MTALFEDVYETVDADLIQEARVSMANFNEILFADDTLLLTTFPEALTLKAQSIA